VFQCKYSQLYFIKEGFVHLRWWRTSLY